MLNTEKKFNCKGILCFDKVCSCPPDRAPLANTDTSYLKYMFSNKDTKTIYQKPRSTGKSEHD